MKNEDRTHLSLLVVTMRPMTPEQAVRAVQVTTRFHLTRSTPVHLGDPEKIGIRNLDKPDFGDPVTIGNYILAFCGNPPEEYLKIFTIFK